MWCIYPYYSVLLYSHWGRIAPVPVQQYWKISLRWRHNGHDAVSNHQRLDCLLDCLLRHRSKKTSKLRITGLCAGNSPGPVNSPHKRPVTRKMSPFNDVIMLGIYTITIHNKALTKYIILGIWCMMLLDAFQSITVHLPKAICGTFTHSAVQIKSLLLFPY